MELTSFDELCCRLVVFLGMEDGVSGSYLSSGATRETSAATRCSTVPAMQ